MEWGEIDRVMAVEFSMGKCCLCAAKDEVNEKCAMNCIRFLHPLLCWGTGGLRHAILAWQ